MGTIEPIMGTISPPPTVANTLFGQTRREVLALLIGRPDERFYLREILRTVGGGSGAVQRELSRLVEGGLVEREREGRQVYFSANRDAAIFPELRGIIQKTAGAADVLRASLAPLLREDRLPLAFVYGSVARDEQSARSDVDVMILGDVTLAEVIPSIRVAEQKLGRDINPSVYPIREYRAKLKRRAPFLKRVMAGPKLFIKGDERELGRLAR
jgi:DNA-binding transcriptional ArsR family regulator